MGKAKAFNLMCRQHLFREQVARFRRCEYRRPSLSDIRRMWRETGFRTA